MTTTTVNADCVTVARRIAGPVLTLAIATAGVAHADVIAHFSGKLLCPSELQGINIQSDTLVGEMAIVFEERDWVDHHGCSGNCSDRRTVICFYVSLLKEKWRKVIFHKMPERFLVETCGRGAPVH